jgi:small conductance mechanosensitive channel
MSTKKIALWCLLILVLIAVALAGTSLAPEEADYGNEWWWDTYNAFATHAPDIVLWLAIGVVAYLLLHRLVPRLVKRTMDAKERGRLQAEIEQRTNTLTNVITGTGTVLVAILVVIGVLRQIGLDMTAVMGALAVFGLAIGFGAQNLVRDMIAGFFILLEDQYCVGDWIAIGGVNGEVEKLNLRRTCVRDLDGVIHSVPNGAVSLTSNYTKDFGRCNVVVSVAYKEDLDRVMAIVRQTWYEICDDPELGPKITQRDPWILRIDNLGDSGIDIRIVAETLPDWQWTVMAQMKLRLKKVFDELGIEIPWPHTKIFFGDFPEGVLLDTTKRGQRQE